MTHLLHLRGSGLKPLSVTTNVVGLQTDDAGHVDRNSSAHVAHVVGLQTDAVVVTETRLKGPLANLRSFMVLAFEQRSESIVRG